MKASGMTDESQQIRQIREAVDAVTRYAARGCSGASCDLARGAWMSNQLGIIGRTAGSIPDEVKSSYGEVPWAQLIALTDVSHGLSSMTADEMQQFVEQVLPKARKALRTRM